MRDQAHFLHIGEIYREHGLHGEVKVYLYSGSSENFYKGIRVWIENPREKKWEETKIEKVKPFQKFFLTQFAFLKNPEDASQWRKARIFIPRSDLKPIPKGEHYIQDLMGLEVWEGGQRLGKIIRFEGEGDSALFVIEDEHQKEQLIPYVPQWIIKVEQQKIIMSLPEGLLD